MTHNILEEINESNSSNYKLGVLQKYFTNTQLQRILKLCYDKTTHSFGVTNEQIEKFTPKTLPEPVDLDFVLTKLEDEFSTRKITGHKALQLASNLFENLEEKDKNLVKKIVNRDLRINVGRTQINKIWKGLIVKPIYMRCGVYSEKTAKKISYPAQIELKSDGTFREFTVKDSKVSAISRSGEEYEYPVLFKEMENFPDGIYIGELTVRGITNRAEGNGLINSDYPPHDNIILQLWDTVSELEYQNAGNKIKNTTPYKDRFNSLRDIINTNLKNISLIPHKEINNIKEALQQTSLWMNQGLEGAILKNYSGVFRDGTSPDQLKLKLEIDGEFRITGFQEGTKGTKREGKIGSILFENDEGTIKGRTSGFSDKQLDLFTKNQDKLLGKIMTVQFNDITKARGNEFYALSHPRFIEIRNDKEETNTLEEIKELICMAKEL